MGINKIKLVMLITASSILSSSTCTKSGTNPCTRNVYFFSVASEFSAQREIYNVGDTIYLNSSFSKSLKDIAINKVIDYSNSVGISGNCTIFELDSVTQNVLPVITKFKFHKVTGDFSNNSNRPNEIKDIFYMESANIYDFKMGIIIQQKGIYALYISDLGSMGIRNKNCTNAGFANTLTNTNKNLNLFQHAMNRPPASQFEIDRIYCFRVQ